MKPLTKIFMDLTNGAGVNIASEGDVSIVTEEYLYSDSQALASALVRLPSDPTTRYIGAPRASSLYACCIRQHVLGTKHRAKKTEYLSFKEKLRFGWGNAVHYWLQNFPDAFGDARRGFWKCRACGEVSDFGPPPLHACANCGANPEAFEYLEHTILLKEPPFSGHPDMFLERRTGVLRICEFKTMEGDLFEKLVAPQIDHVWQLTAYMWGCERQGVIPRLDCQNGYLFYFAKKEKQDMFPVKCFLVKRSYVTIQEIQIKLFEYQNGKRGVLPSCHKECWDTKFQHYRAKACPVLKICQERV